MPITKNGISSSFITIVNFFGFLPCHHMFIVADVSGRADLPHLYAWHRLMSDANALILVLIDQGWVLSEGS
jgi:hypothetical protein